MTESKVGGWGWVNGKGRGNGDPAPRECVDNVECRSLQCRNGCRRAADDRPVRWVSTDGTTPTEGQFSVPTIAGDGAKLTINEAMCKRIIELEGQLKGLEGKYRSSVQTHQDVSAAHSRAVAENNRLRAESRHQYELANKRAARIFELQRELANERDLGRGAGRLLPGFQKEVISLREQREELRAELRETQERAISLATSLDLANEKLAQIEESLEGPGSHEDVVHAVVEALGF
ncbi:hypothetical protein ABZY93_22365 [Streptomyces smyrnaeus]|uniref:hypothetical protein n=1 Tax=Streptomyces smyrnaeus TaxID=1387713 RepID=UPI0033BAF4CB